MWSQKFVFLVLFQVILLQDLTLGAEKKEILPNCKKMMMVLAKRQLKEFGECMRELKAVVSTRAEIGEKIQCVVKCVLDREGLLNEEKKVTKDTMQRFMDGNIPLIYHVLSHDLLEHCYDEFGPKMDHDDAYCTAYGDFVKCVQDVVADVC